MRDTFLPLIIFSERYTIHILSRCLPYSFATLPLLLPPTLMRDEIFKPRVEFQKVQEEQRQFSFTLEATSKSYSTDTLFTATYRHSVVNLVGARYAMN
ncbi:hypothetical protein RB195_014123 [Necator americanus]|uniref:Uncharacterized protein n=1 Tax=Necator americanus TaxID=51031 RepID=A0ABR1DYR4_NECAM